MKKLLVTYLGHTVVSTVFGVGMLIHRSSEPGALSIMVATTQISSGTFDLDSTDHKTFFQRILMVCLPVGK